jgi:TPR repeat protein
MVIQRRKSTLELLIHLGQGFQETTPQPSTGTPKAADQDYVQAQSDLAALYHLGGQGVPQDDAAAVRRWKKAAEQGDVTAQGNLGTAYGLGTGVPKDNAESLRWRTKAAENGNAASQFSLEVFYSQGTGVPKDEAEGVKWLRKSADQGNAAVSSGLELRITLAQASQRTPPKLCVGIARQATKATQRLNTTSDRLTT